MDRLDAWSLAGALRLDGHTWRALKANEGGLEEFTRTALNAQLPKRELTRERQDVYHFRPKAGPQIARRIRDGAAPKAAEKRAKKVVGGCGV